MHATADRPCVAKVTENGPVQPAGNGEHGLSVLQSSQPPVKDLRLFNLVSHINTVVHGQQIVKVENGKKMES
jgi:hypothetical protein